MIVRFSIVEDNTPVKLALFFSHGMSLEVWENQGLFDREVGYYRQLMRELGPVLFVTYDKHSLEWYRRLLRIDPIFAVGNGWGLHYSLFGIFAAVLHRKELQRYDVFKTNQLSGAWTASIAARLLGKPLIVRGGFVPSLFAILNRENSVRLKKLLLMERFSLRSAHLIFVTTKNDRDYLAQTHSIPLERFRIIPNPIDIDRFRPEPNAKKEPGLVAYVGRFSEQKNLPLLVNACTKVKNARLLLVGKGEIESDLHSLSVNDKVAFEGHVSNNRLPAILNRAEMFVLPSKYEGSPKALLEAMACGLAVVGTDVPGIREVIQHKINGLLCNPTVEELSSAISELLHDAALRKRLGTAAREFVSRYYSQSEIARTEAREIRLLLSERRA
jgi:glycosyltransferase involved in cell wall biosynthesis